MESLNPVLEPEVKKRTQIVQKVIDRLVDPLMGSMFEKELLQLMSTYPDNERPLDNNLPNIILMNGEVLRADTFVK